jgi:hypothetical protein
MSDLLEWIDTEAPKLAEREAVKLLRRVFTEQFEVVEGKLELITQRPSRAVQNPSRKRVKSAFSYRRATNRKCRESLLSESDGFCCPRVPKIIFFIVRFPEGVRRTCTIESRIFLTVVVGDLLLGCS